MKIILNKCEVCKNMIPPFNRKGVKITRQSKYDERKTCSDHCANLLRANGKVKTGVHRPRTMFNPKPIDKFLLGYK